MEEHDAHEKRVDLHSELGMTRRDMLRRGAVVGGALLWVAPAIQSIAPKAMAQAQGPSPGTCAACYCWTGAADKSSVTDDECSEDGPVFERANADACEQFCESRGYQFHEYCSGTSPNCSCSQFTDPGPAIGVVCS